MPKFVLLDEGEDDQAADLRVNAEYARRFEYNKRREELHRLQAKHPELAHKIEGKLKAAAVRKGQQTGQQDAENSEVSSDEEEEDDGEIPEDTEAQILDVLLKIKQKDPKIYKPDVKFFEAPESGEEGGSDGEQEERGGESGKGTKSKSKPMYLKDVIAKQALVGDASGSISSGESGSDDDDDSGHNSEGLHKGRNPKVYDEEQAAIKAAFLSAVDDDDAEEQGDFGGVLKARSKQQDGDAKEKRGIVAELAEKVFEEANADGGEAFLKSYILNQGWKEQDGVHSVYDGGSDDEDEEQEGFKTGGIDFEEDEEFLEEADRYEAAYNFRFEEPGGAHIITHPRNVEGIVRKPDDRRKRQREEKAKRKSEEAARLAEEVKRLKKAKRMELEEHLQKVQRVAGEGAGEDELLAELLDGDFDPEEYDRRMAAAFNDDYYKVEEELEEGAIPEELQPELGDVTTSTAAGFGAVREKLLHGQTTGSNEDEEMEVAGEEGRDGNESDGEQNAELGTSRADTKRLLEEYYKLDYEDQVAGIACRFKYREVPKSNFGLNIEDILMLSDKELNQVMGLKRLAPYREETGRKERPNYKALQAVKQERLEKQQWKQHKQSYSKQPHKRQKFEHGNVKVGKQAADNAARPVATSSNPPQVPEDKEAARLASYAKLTLKKSNPSSAFQPDQTKHEPAARQKDQHKQQHRNAPAKKTAQKEETKKAPSVQVPVWTVPEGLTKAQRKNYIRSLKRAAAKPPGGA